MLLNYGIAYLRKYDFKVFIPCDNTGEEPDFSLHILTRIDTTRSACYEAVISKCFSEWTILVKNIILNIPTLRSISSFYLYYVLIVLLPLSWTDTLDEAIDFSESKGCKPYYPQYAPCIIAFDEHDVEVIQAVLDDSSDDEDVELLSDDDREMPKPIK